LKITEPGTSELQSKKILITGIDENKNKQNLKQKQESETRDQENRVENEPKHKIKKIIIGFQD
jgi:hypothetical protein